MIATPRKSGGNHDLLFWVVIGIVLLLFFADLAMWVELGWPLDH